MVHVFDIIPTLVSEILTPMTKSYYKTNEARIVSQSC